MTPCAQEVLIEDDNVFEVYFAYLSEKQLTLSDGN